MHGNGDGIRTIVAERFNFRAGTAYKYICKFRAKIFFYV
jgi:hypothetical protein